MRRLFFFLIVALIVIIGILAYLLGRKSNPTINENVVSNSTLIKEIAELSSLEVQGNTTFKHTNVQNDGSFSDAMRKMFTENTVNISVPYTAKYGVNLQGQEVKISQKDSTVTIYLPKPQLLSYELRLDKLNTVSQKGLFQSNSTADFDNFSKKMYTMSRQQMENSTLRIEEAQARIQKILTDYYAPMHYKLTIIFDQDLTEKKQ